MTEFTWRPNRQEFTGVSSSKMHDVTILTATHSAQLDVAAFLSVLEEANRLLSGGSGYALRVVTVDDQIASAKVYEPGSAEATHKTTVVTGTCGSLDAHSQAPHIRSLREELRGSNRIVACGEGTYLLAEMGLLKDRAVVIHWALQERFHMQFPTLTSNTERLYAEDSGIYTCAGSVSSFDCALALVEQDFGSRLAGEIARSLLLHHRRSGAAHQVSPVLRAHAVAPDMFSKLLAWLPEHLQEDLSVKALAARAAMSPRNFARVFLQRMGVTPARYVESLRFEVARGNLHNARSSIFEAAEAGGFQSVETMRRVFQRRLGKSPAQFRQDTREHPQQAQISTTHVDINLLPAIHGHLRQPKPHYA